MVRQTKRLIRAPASSSKTWQGGDGSVAARGPESAIVLIRLDQRRPRPDATNHGVVAGAHDAEERGGGEAHPASR